MTDQEKINRVKSLVSQEPSGWREEAEYRKANRRWLKRSAEIAVRILGELHRRGITQADLARMMEVTPQQVTKLIKGQENLTLDTIGRIELALNISLINIEKSVKSKEKGFHALAENVMLSQTIDLEGVDEVKNDKVRPLYISSAHKYYE